MFSADESTAISAVGLPDIALSVKNLADCSDRGSVPAPRGSDIGYTLSPDGQKRASIATPDPSGFAFGAVQIGIDEADAQGNFPGSRRVSDLIDAGQVYDGQSYFNHRVVFSPSGEQVAFALVNGRVGVMDVQSMEVRLSDHVRWHTSTPTPIPDLVMTEVEGLVAHAVAVADLRTGAVLRTHDTNERLVSQDADGYVLRDGGSLQSTHYNYETGAATPADAGSHDPFELPDVRISADGGTTCDIRPTGHGQSFEMCLNGACALTYDVTGSRVSSGLDCAARNNGSALFLLGDSVWTWAGVGYEGMHFSAVPGLGERSRFFRLSDAHVGVLSHSHIGYWSL